MRKKMTMIEKAHEQQVAQYLLYGGDFELDSNITTVPIEERCKQAEEKYEEYMQKILRDNEGTSPEFEEALNKLIAATDVYFEAGLISGFKLACSFWCQSSGSGV